MAKITGCCGCFDLRNGSMVIGVISLGSMCFTFGYSLFFLMTFLDISPLYFKFNPSMGYGIGVVIPVSAMCIIFNSLLIHGAKTGRRRMVLAWLIFSAIYLYIKSFAILALIVYLALLFAWIPVLAPSLVMYGGLLFGWQLAEWYWYAVVNKFYHQMTSPEEPLGHSTQNTSPLELQRHVAQKARPNVLYPTITIDDYPSP